MKIETKFDIGERVYVISHDGMVKGPFTIGQVRVSITDSPGIEGEEIFDNYKAQKDRSESYMCIGTGIGSGTVWYADRVRKVYWMMEDFQVGEYVAIKPKNKPVPIAGQISSIGRNVIHVKVPGTEMPLVVCPHQLLKMSDDKNWVNPVGED